MRRPSLRLPSLRPSQLASERLQALCALRSALLRSAGFTYQNDFGTFKNKASILFLVDRTVQLHLLAIIPTLIIGFVGGALPCTVASLPHDLPHDLPHSLMTS